MFLFNKREIFKGWVFGDFCGVRDALEAAGIDYRYKIGSNMAEARAGRIRPPLGSSPPKHYPFTVKKLHFAQAQKVLSKRRPPKP